MTPREIVHELDKHIVGQDSAKRAVAIALRNRWRRMQLCEELRAEITPKSDGTSWNDENENWRNDDADACLFLLPEARIRHADRMRRATTTNEFTATPVTIRRTRLLEWAAFIKIADNGR